MTAQITEGARRIETLLRQTLEEQSEEFALTDATHSRSTSRKKSRTDRARESGEIDAYCMALAFLTMDRTPFEVLMRVKGES